MKGIKAEEIIGDLPTGPLGNYRKRASFNWKLLRYNLYGEDQLLFQEKLWNLFKVSSVFKSSRKTVPVDEQRRQTILQMRALLTNDILPYEHPHWINSVLYFNPSLTIKTGITFGMVVSTMMALGTEQHGDIIEKLQDGRYTGCFALTEVAHGSDVRGMKTTATYDPNTKSFILHSEDFKAAKCWVGGLGQTSTHAMVFAQLITPDKKNRGLHLFIVPIRDPETLLPYPRVTVGDLGEKIGLNGIDNGFVMFHNYRIPRINLLNKTGDVTEDGKYVSRLKKESQRLGASLGALSMGRVNITCVCTKYISLAIVIAIRYCAVRKQFGPSLEEEWPVIEYQVQQWRLFPHLATTYVMTIFSEIYVRKLRSFQISLLTSENRELVSAEGMEFHALSSAVKPLCSWMTRDAIQDCREACGGHGYLAASRLGQLRADNDPNCTYEGENNVLIQQASNWLLGLWSNILEGKEISSPVGSASFLSDGQNILQLKFNHTTIEEVLAPENLLTMLKWLICYYLKKTHQQVVFLKKNGESDFSIRNNSQVFLARTLALVYAEHTLMKTFLDHLQESMWSSEEKSVLTKLGSLYAATCLEKRLGDLYAGGYASTSDGIDTLLREGIITLCKDLLNEAVALVDVLAPPDFIVNSPLGFSDGEVYKHMEQWILKNPENLERPSWWREALLSKL
ncbi:peroxisomal acyl-coenzyme A oxidase 3 isoform X2 [Cephus cinctus]|nr:peroxisomal acyl-coenzyme A oxidase 3 isoform X2 [Cephus cinctus]